MAATVTLNLGQLPNAVDVTQQEFIFDGTIAFTGSYASGGDTLDLTPLFATTGASDQIPNLVQIVEQPTSGNAPTGYVFYYIQGTTQKNGLIYVAQCAGSGNPFSQLGAGAYPAALLAATINVKIRVWLTKYV